MTRNSRTPPRLVRWALAVVAVLIPCVVYGVTTASADLSLGPHEATYAVTTNGLITADLGPLGRLELDSPLPARLGVLITVKEIPDDLTAIDTAQTLDALSGDLNAYLQFFSGPRETIDRVAHALLMDAVHRTVYAFALVAVLGIGGYVVVGRDRRRELAAIVAPRTWQLAAGLVIVTVVAAVSAGSGRLVEPTDPAEPASPVFAGTALEGARITGRLAGVVDTFGTQLTQAYQANTEFYEVADVNLRAAWNARSLMETLAAVEPPEAPTPAVSAGSEADASATPGLTPTPAAQLVTVLVVSDLHCNTGMTPLIRTIAQRSGARIVLNAGDTTVNGTALESFCVNSFASAVPKGATMVVADGNHDSSTTSAQERAAGVRVLGGDVIEVAGMRILGDHDALETRLGEGSTEARDETIPEQADRLARTACEAEDGIDLLLVHRPAAGAAGLDSGCVPVQISGHMHARTGPVPAGGGVLYVSGSTAGAKSGELTVGPLHGVAQMTLLRFDPEQRRFLDWQLIEVKPSGTATVGDRQPFPEPAAEAPPAEEAGPEETGAD